MPTLLSLIADAARLSGDARHPASVTAVATTTAPGAMPPLHVHEHDEAFHVLEGELTLHVGAETVALGPGESFVAPAGVPHTHRAERLTRHLTMACVASAGRYDEWVRTVARPVPALAGDWADCPEAAAAGAIAGANGIRVLGPPGALPPG
jgi:quercetin dioxygenase-like cupin family protein